MLGAAMSQSATQPGIARLLRPRSIAIVGASAEPTAAGARVLANLELVGYQGDIHLVSRRAPEILGRPCVPSIEELPRGVDAAVLVVPEAAVADAVASCVRQGIGGAVVFAAGFAETGVEGRVKQDRIAALAREGGLALNGPNCMGFTNFVDRVSFSFGAIESEVLAPGAGGVAVIAQSGAMMGNIASALGAKGVSVNYTISTGNEAVIGVEDFLAPLIDDAQTGVIVLFMEQIRRPARFLALVAEARRKGKPIVRHAPGQHRARPGIRPHPYRRARGQLRGDARSHAPSRRRPRRDHGRAVRRGCATGALARGRPARRCRGEQFRRRARHLARFLRVARFDLPRLTPATVAALRPIVPSFVPVDNPLDLATAGMGQPDIYDKTARIMLADENIGCAILSMVPGTPSLQMAKAESLVPLVKTEAKPVAFVMLGDEVPLVPAFMRIVRDSRLPFFRSPDRAMRAMAHLAAHGARRLAGEAVPAPPPRQFSAPAAGVLPEYRAKAFFAEAGIPCPPGALARDAGEAHAIAARVGYPVAIKAQAVTLPHKSEVGGVVTGIADAGGLDAAWTALHARLARARPELVLDGILVERMAPPGLEMIVGAKRDPEWGPMVLVGLGGIWTEALDDIALFPADLALEDILAEIHGSEARACWPECAVRDPAMSRRSRALPRSSARSWWLGRKSTKSTSIR